MSNSLISLLRNINGLSNVNPIDNWFSNSVNMDIAETKDSYKILIDMPGRKREDISIDLDGRKLIISSPQLVEDDNDCTYILSERNRSSIRNSLLLPFNVDPDKLDALFEDGVLKITIQKINVSQTKKIEIS